MLVLCVLSRPSNDFVFAFILIICFPPSGLYTDFPLALNRFIRPSISVICCSSTAMLYNPSLISDAPLLCNSRPISNNWFSNNSYDGMSCK